MSQTHDAPETQGDLTFVSDSDGPEWHIAAEFVVAPAASVWAMCGLWPQSRLGWRTVRWDNSGLHIHDTCRFWAGIWRPWLYVRSANSDVWHVRASGSVDTSAELSALCGHLSGPDGWISTSENPAGLTLHTACREERDRADQLAWARDA